MRPHGDASDVKPAIFNTLDMQLVRGRAFTDHDAAGAPRVAILSDELSREVLHSTDVVDRRVPLGPRSLEQRLSGGVHRSRVTRLTSRAHSRVERSVNSRTLTPTATLDTLSLRKDLSEDRPVGRSWTESWLAKNNLQP